MPRKNKKTTKLYYLDYPFKTMDLTSSTVPLPYFPKKEISDHKWALTYRQWRKIMDVWLKYVWQCLQQGYDYKFGSKIGHLTLTKYHSEKGTPEWYPEKYKDDPRLQGYRLHLKWVRSRKERTAVFRDKWVWSFKYSPNLLKDSYNYFSENRGRINKLKDSYLT